MRKLSDVIDEIAKEQRARGYPGRSAEEIEAQLREDEEYKTIEVPVTPQGIIMTPWLIEDIKKFGAREEKAMSKINEYRQDKQFLEMEQELAALCEKKDELWAKLQKQFPLAEDQMYHLNGAGKLSFSFVDRDE